MQGAVEAGAAADEPHGVREELGDLLFITAKVAQMSGVDPEEALHANISKNAARFRRVEELAAGQGKTTDKLSREEFLALWAQAKEQLRQTH